MSKAQIVDGEASESEDETSEESQTQSVNESGLTIGGFSLSSVTASVEKRIGAFSRQATKDLDNITKGQLRRSSTMSTPDSVEEGQVKSPTHKSLLHKKLYEKNVAIYNNANAYFQDLFSKNDSELQKVNEDMNTTEIYLQESAMAMQHSVHFCNELEENLRSMNTSVTTLKFPRNR